MSSFSTWMSALTSRTWSWVMLPGHEFHGPALHVLEAPLVPVEPVMGLLGQDLDGLVGRARMARRAGRGRASRRGAAPRRREGPRDGGVGEAHPAEPVVGGVERVQPGDGAVGDPVGVVHPAGHGVVLDLGRVGVAAALVVEAHAGEVDERVEGVEPLRAVGLEPLVVVPAPQIPVHGQLDVVEAAVRPGRARPWPGSSRSTCRRGRRPGWKWALPTRAVR